MKTIMSLEKRNRTMRRCMVALFALIAICGYMEARTIIVEVRNIRSDKGNVLVMAKAGEDSAPVYGMAKPEKGKAIIRLENVSWEKFDLSVFHDENENMQMDLTEEQRPAEGYAQESCGVKEEEATFKLRLYYPVSE